MHHEMGPELTVVLRPRRIPHTGRIRDRTRVFQQQFVALLPVHDDVLQERRDLLGPPSRAREEQVCEARRGVDRQLRRGEVCERGDRRVLQIVRLSEVAALFKCQIGA